MRGQQCGSLRGPENGGQVRREEHGREEGARGHQAEGGLSEEVVAWPWARPSPARPLESRQDPDAPQARLEDPSRRPGDRGEVMGWLAHLAHVELSIGVWEASELPGTAVEVDIAGSKGGQEAQVVVHWETQAGSERLAPRGLPSAPPIQLQA